jgi:drug/metabolite transporter (DMT)-like permease
VAVWGTGYIATKVGLQYAAPFTFLALRFAFGLVCLFPVIFLWKTRWPRTAPELGHLVVAGLLMHAVQLGGSHYAQYLGMSAGVAALVISCQPLITAFLVFWLYRERIYPGQWLGVFLGLAGVTLVVWHKIDVREVGLGSLVATIVALAGVTAATLYQRRFSPQADLKAAAAIQFAASLLVLAPLAVALEGFVVDFSFPLFASIAYLVVFGSILAVSVLHLLMRRGEATRVTSMMYLPPVFAVGAELVFFSVVPSALSFAGMALACAGVAMTVWNKNWKSSTSSR